MRKLLLMTLMVALAMAFMPLARPVLAVSPRTLVKGSGPAVYYVTDDGVRHVFPNQSTFLSWYPKGNKQPNIIKLSDAELANLPLGKNVTVRPGSQLVKIKTDPKVYAISKYGVLRWVTSEALARRLYGPDWNRKVLDIPDEFFVDYTMGPELAIDTRYGPSAEMAGASDIQSNFMPAQNNVSDGWMTADQKRRAEQLTSVFESGTVAFDYAVVVNLGDGRGYTSGRIGFTTATGDAYEAVKRYTDRKPQNPLAKFLPRLKDLRENEDGSVTGLEGYPQAWAQAAQDPLFRQVQDELNDEIYYRPAMRLADQLGLKTALAKAAMYDAIIQHGNGTSEDSLSALVKRTNDITGGSPSSGIDEKIWLSNFLDVRKEDLLNARNPDTRQAWAESAGRVDVYRQLADSGNYDLTGPIVINAPVYEGTVS